ncbi:AAA family ATPase [Agrobacterium vitis]|uniref:ATP-dependent nuclease n=1 Tax=Allorhizobium ampelinum TaxID=3025782 RepID=UPI001F3D2183|nr:AAA family ATPase [Allorhizobium ampelinum]MCF1482836.1 AAA family ATPase [Allorhizobium ampelinum]
MKIVSARIKNYRTIKDETTLEIEKGLMLVGPNNAGKTNILKAVRLFFTGFNNDLNYSREHDLSFGQNSQQTSIAITFQFENQDGEEIPNTLQQITTMLGVTLQTNDEFTVYLTFSGASNPSYRVFPNSKRPVLGTQKANYSRLERSLVDSIFRKFSVHYIPSDKSTEQLYNDLVLPFLLRKAYTAILPNMSAIQAAMNGASSSLNSSMRAAGLANVECSFNFPSDHKRFFKEVDFSLSDPTATSIFNKGMGIQSAALLAAFNWITLEEVNDGKSVLWLLEEPESYLHPELASQCDRLINELRGRSQVVCTTHSLAFVPQDPLRILGIIRENGWTKAQPFKTYTEATDRIRKSLGVKFGDYYNMNHFNILVEGEIDREYLNYFSEKIKEHGKDNIYPIMTSKSISFLDYGGVSGLEGFVKATYQFIREERPCIILVDGDNAGDKCRRNLQNYLGQKKINFEANKNFVIVRDRFAIEGLFPDEWVTELYNEHPSWIEAYSVDASGTLMPFSIPDAHKRQFMTWMRTKGDNAPDLQWASRWFELIKLLENVLRAEAVRIYGVNSDALQLIQLALPTTPR